MVVRITSKGINSAVGSPRSTRAFNRMRQDGVDVAVANADNPDTICWPGVDHYTISSLDQGVPLTHQIRIFNEALEPLAID